MEVLAVDTGDDGSEDELGGPKDHADDAFESHGERLGLLLAVDWCKWCLEFLRKRDYGRRMVKLQSVTGRK